MARGHGSLRAAVELSKYYEHRARDLEAALGAIAPFLPPIGGTPIGGTPIGGTPVAGTADAGTTRASPLGARTADAAGGGAGVAGATGGPADDGGHLLHREARIRAKLRRAAAR